MFDAKRVAQIAKQSKADWWPYPKTFSALKEAGVVSQKVKVENYYSCYTNGSQEWVESIPEGFQPLTIAENFDEKAIINALNRRINHEITYVEFLKGIAEAGVLRYQVNMPMRTVTYFGKNEKDKYIQNIPLYKDKT